jgi:hypothetical protein
MKTQCLFMMFGLAFAGLAAEQTPPPVSKVTAPVPAPAPAETAPQPADTPAPPPAAPAKRSAADLEKLVAPIALYPDPLLATLLPASVYPLEIVQAARFVSNTNNLAKLDEQPWDKSVKDVARVPDAIKKLNDDISWTIELGEAFLAQDKDIMDAIQAMRNKAQKAGTLQTTPQQVVVVTNMVVEKTVEQQVVVVTNTVVQIQPSSSSVVYVPAYNPYTVYYPPPAYVYNPVAPLVTFTAGVAMGAIIANNCNWYGGGCYHGDVDIDIDKNVNRNVNRDGNRNANRDGSAGARASTTGTQKKWQPDQSRLSKSGAPSTAASARNAEARGWGSSGARPSTGSSGARPSTGTAGARPSTGTAGARPSTGAAGARPSTGTPSAGGPAPSAGASRPTPSASGSRPSASPSASPSRSGSGSAYGGMSSGASARSSSSRGASSRSGGFSGGGRGGGGRR